MKLTIRGYISDAWFEISMASAFWFQARLALEKHKLVWFCQDVNRISAKIAFYSANQVKPCWHLGCLKHSEGNWSEHIIVHSPWWILPALACSREAYWGIWLLPFLKAEFAQLMIIAALNGHVQWTCSLLEFSTSSPLLTPWIDLCIDRLNIWWIGKSEFRSFTQENLSVFYWKWSGYLQVKILTIILLGPHWNHLFSW